MEFLQIIYIFFQALAAQLNNLFLLWSTWCKYRDEQPFFVRALATCSSVGIHLSWVISPFWHMSLSTHMSILSCLSSTEVVECRLSTRDLLSLNMWTGMSWCSVPSNSCMFLFKKVHVSATSTADKHSAAMVLWTTYLPTLIFFSM